MPELKPWYQSKTVWGALIAVGASMLKLAGVELADGMQEELADGAVSLAGTLGGLLALYGRISATTTLKR